MMLKQVILLIALASIQSVRCAQKDYDETCDSSAPDTCDKSGQVNLECSGSPEKCKCKANFYMPVPKTTDCAARKIAGAGCVSDGPLECVDGFECSEDATTKKKTCTKKAAPPATTPVAGELGGVCKPQAPFCTEPNAECKNTKCACKSGYTAQGKTCTAAPPATTPVAGELGGDCKPQAPFCTEPNAECKNTKCACKCGYTAQGKTCNGVGFLQASVAMVVLTVMTSVWSRG